MAARITREFLDRMRDDPDFLEATPGDASEAVAIIDLAISALSHPAALERARAEERERIDDLLTGLNVDPIKAAPEAHVGDFYAGVDAGINAALDAIRALGPVPRPSPEAEPAGERAITRDAIEDRLRMAFRRLGGIHALARAPDGAEKIVRAAALELEADMILLSARALAAEATTPPALAPELRERLVKLLRRMSEMFLCDGTLKEIDALLSALSPQTDGGAK